MSEHKALTGWEVKDADKGTVQAVFSTFDVIDHDNDVTEKGAFEDGAPVRISAYGHASWGSALPVGKGVIRAGEKEAVLDGRFFLDTQPGRDTFTTVREMGDLQEWSYGFQILESGDGDKDGTPVRFLRKLAVDEVSPVLKGAGIDTRTLAMKQNLENMTFSELSEWKKNYGIPLIEPASLRDVVDDLAGAISKITKSFGDEAEHALGSVQAITTRAQALGSLRAEKEGKTGRVLSAANRDRLANLLAAMGDAHIALDELLRETDPEKHRQAISSLAARFHVREIEAHL